MKTRPVSALPVLILVALLVAQPVARSAYQVPGSMDTTFNPPANLGTVLSVTVQPDGKIILGGGSWSFDVPPVTFVRLLPDGAVDQDFHPGSGPDQAVEKVLLLKDGRILIGGAFTSYNHAPVRGLVRLNRNGTLDTTFVNPVLDGAVNNIVRQKDGKLIITGGFNQVNHTSRNRIARLLADGSLDPGFNPGALIATTSFYDPVFYAVAEQDNGRILVGGRFASLDANLFYYFARFNSDGSHDPTFRPPVVLAPVFALAFQSTGQILVGGEFWAPRVNLLRISPADGALDESFDADIGTVASDPIVTTLLVQPDDRVLLGGANFSEIGALARNLIGRLHADGGGDASFDPGTGPNFNWVGSLALAAGGSIYAGGSFTGFNGLPAPGLVRLHNDSFAPRVQFTSASYIGFEDGGRGVTVTIRRSGPTDRPLRVDFQTRPGTAKRGQDFKTRAGTLKLATGEIAKSFTLDVRDDRKAEGPESFTIQLRRASDRNVEIGPLDTAVLTILDDEMP